MKYFVYSIISIIYLRILLLIFIPDHAATLLFAIIFTALPLSLGVYIVGKYVFLKNPQKKFPVCTLFFGIGFLLFGVGFFMEFSELSGMFVAVYWQALYFCASILFLLAAYKLHELSEESQDVLWGNVKKNFYFWAAAVIIFFVLLQLLFLTSGSWHLQEVLMSMVYVTLDGIILASITYTFIPSSRYFGNTMSLFAFGFLVKYAFDFHISVFSYENHKALVAVPIVGLLIIFLAVIDVMDNYSFSMSGKERQEEFIKFVRRVVHSMEDVHVALEEICKRLSSSLQVGSVNVYIRDGATMDYVPVYSLTKKDSVLHRKSALVNGLRVYGKSMVMQSILEEQNQSVSIGEKEELQEILDSMILERINIAVPMPIGKEPFAVLAIGPKLLAEIYTNEEIQLVTSVAEEIAPLLVNKYKYESAMARVAMSRE